MIISFFSDEEKEAQEDGDLSKVMQPEHGRAGV